MDNLEWIAILLPDLRRATRRWTQQLIAPACRNLTGNPGHPRPRSSILRKARAPNFREIPPK
jgi:hypothetical protein